MLNEFNEGGSHETNPLGGIPIGVGQNGQQNTVEEGETMKGDFIYSDRIIFTPEIVSQFNLPKSLSNKTAAEASKIINNKFEGRNDKITTSTKKSMLDKVAQAQETIKQAQAQEIAAAQQVNSTEVPDMMNGQVPQGMEEFTQPMAYGGNLQNKMNFGGFFQGQQGQNNMGMIGNMAGNMGNSMNTYGQQMNQSKLPEGYVDEKAMQDAQGNQMIDSTKDTIASATGPIGQMFRGIQKAGQGIGNSIGGEGGAAVSGIFSPEEGTMSAMKDKDLSIGQKALATIPGVGGVIAKRQADKRLNKWKFEKDTFEANSKVSDFAMGGKMYGGGGPFDKSMVSYDPNNISNQTIPLNTISEGLAKWYSPNTSVTSNETVTPARTFGPQGGHSNYAELKNVKDKVGEKLNKTGEFIKDNKGMLRYAPVAMNAFQLHKLNKEGYDKVNPIINNTRYNPQYMDERALTNQINAESNYAGNALANASNGSLGALSNSILASQLNKTRALSDAYSKVADVNRNENKAGQQFNLSVDEANIGRRIAAEDKTAMNKGAFKTEQSKLRGQIGTDLGEIGKEEIYKKMAEKVTGYDWMGKYKQQNPNATKEEIQTAWTKQYLKENPNSTEEDAKKALVEYEEKQKSKFKPAAQFAQINFGEGVNYKSKYIK